MNLNSFLLNLHLRNAWIQEPHMKIYVRRSKRSLDVHLIESCLDLASVEVSEKYRGKGLFTKFVERFEQAAEDLDRTVFVESILEPRLVGFFEGRGYKQMDNSTPTCPCLFKERT